MIGTIRKHQQWLWLLIITVTIISFVVFFSPNTNPGKNGPRSTEYYVNGKPVTINGQPITHEEFVKAYRETILSSFMRTGGREWPNNDESTQKQLERDAIFRVFLLKKMKEMDVQVSEKAVAQVARDRLGNFPLASFEKEYLLPRGLTVEDFERYLRNDLAIQQLISTAAVSAKLYSPSEAEALYRKQHEENETRVATFWASNYLDKVTVTPDELSRYYTNHMAEYRLPERVVVNYVSIPASNFLAEADKQLEKRTNFTAEVDNIYYKRGTNYFKGTNGAVLSEADAKKQIKDDFRQEWALMEARKKASEFGNVLYNTTQPEQTNQVDNFVKQAATNGLVVKTSPPLERQVSTDENAKDKEFTQEIRDRAFKLNRENPIAFTPIRGEDAVYIIAFKERINSALQPMDKVMDKLTKDYKNSKALELASKAGRDFYTAATNGLAKKETFEAIATQARVPFVTPPRFSTATSTLTNMDERISLNTLQTLATELKPGEVSTYTPTMPGRSPEGRYLPPQGGFVVYLKAKVPVDDATVKKELPEFLARMRSYRQNEVFNQWFRKQVEQSKLYIAPARETTGITTG